MPLALVLLNYNLSEVSMIIAFTGHRPDKLGGYGTHTFDRLTELACAVINHYKPERIISGMALGWDQAAARAAVQLGTPFTAAIPFKGQETQWPDGSQRLYHELLGYANETIYVCDPGYSALKMQVRNEWMVNNANLVVALWNGTSGGTANCISYAKQRGVKVVNVWNSWAKYK